VNAAPNVGNSHAAPAAPARPTADQASEPGNRKTSAPAPEVDGNR
jgi:hypothetical protein